MALDSVLSTPIIPPPPKSASPASSSSGSSGSSGTDGTSSSYGASSSSSDSQSADGAGNSSSGSKAGKTSSSSSSSSASSGAKTQSRQSSATQAQGASSTANAKGATNTPTRKTGGQTFIQTLAQSQADAEESANAVAAVAPEEVLGSKSKAAKDKDADSTLAFLSPALAAAMANIQPANQTSAALAAAQDASIDGVSQGSAGLKDMLADLSQGTAAELKAATDASGSKTDSAASPSVADTSATNTPPATNVSTTSQLQQLESDSKINSTVGTPSFNDELGGKVTWMANQGVQSASLQLSPEHLGPVEVRISVQNGSASVMFTANHADTRAALEQALPKLREMFASQGLSLSDAGVSQQSPRDQSQKQAITAIGSVGGTGNGDESTTSVTTVTAAVSARPGLLDLYA